MNGWIKIGTKLDTKQLEKDIKTAEGQLRQYEREGQKLSDRKTKLEIDIQDYERAKAEIQASTDETLKQAQTTEQVNFVLEAEEMQLAKIKEQYSSQFTELNSINGKLKQNEQNQEAISKEIDSQKQKLAQTNAELQRSQILGSGFNSVNNTMKSIAHSAVRWGLAIFGVRSAYIFLRQSMSTLSSYNTQLGTDIEYIRFALASTLEPVIIRIINLVKTLLYYIGYIAKAWFGVNIFANAGVKKFQKAEKALGGATKSAKELKKQLAGFDEMNVLQDNTDTGGGGGGGGGAGGDLPSFDLSQFEGEIPDWLKWIVDNKDLILSILAGIVAFLVAMKLGLTAIKALGVGLLVAGLVYAIQNLLKYLKDPSWENFGKVLAGIGVAIIGLGIIIGSLPIALIGALVLIVGLIAIYWDKIKAFIQSKIDELGDNILAKLLQNSLNAFDQMMTGLKTFFDGIIQFIQGVFSGDWSKALDGLEKIFDGFLNILLGAVNLTWVLVKTILGVIWKWIYDNVIDPIYQKFKWLFDGIASIFSLIIDVFKSIFGTVFENIKIVINNIKELFKALWEGIKFIFSPVVNFFKDIFDKAKNIIKSVFSPIVDFFGNIWNKVKSKLSEFGSKVGEVVGGAFKKAINSVLSFAESMLNKPVSAINELISAINTLPGVKMSKLKTFKLPRLAKGGIINMPGKGVPIGYSAIGGEHGQEAVLPLTDSQQMALLGEAIGKYISLNATIPVYVGNRQIAREIKRINAEDDFAYNS